MDDYSSVLELLYSIMTNNDECYIHELELSTYDKSRHYEKHVAPLPVQHAYREAVIMKAERDELFERSCFLPNKSLERKIILREIFLKELRMKVLLEFFNNVLTEFLVSNSAFPCDQYDLFADGYFAGVRPINEDKVGDSIESDHIQGENPLYPTLRKRPEDHSLH